MANEKELREYGLKKGMLPADELRAQLKELAETYRTNPEDLEQLLEFKSQFYNYSTNNTMLIQAVNPNATFVASYRTWQKLGYQVIRRGTGIPILRPIKSEYFINPENPIRKDGRPNLKKVDAATEWEKELIQKGEIEIREITTFQKGNVFDISATNCPPEDYPRLYNMGYSSEQHALLYQTIREYIEKEGLKVEERDLSSISLRGEYYPDAKRITINHLMNDTQKLDTLLHEFGHHVMRAVDRGASSPVAELEADAVSIMMAKQAGIEITDVRKRHFADNYRSAQKMPDFNFNRIIDTVNRAYRTWRVEIDPLLRNAVQQQERQMRIDLEQEQQTERENYQRLGKIAPKILSGEQASLRLERPGAEFLFMERNGDRISVAQVFQQGDFSSADPVMTFLAEDGRLSARTYQLDSAAGQYESAETPAGLNRKTLHRLNLYAANWLSQLGQEYPQDQKSIQEPASPDRSLLERFSDRMEAIEQGIRQAAIDRQQAKRQQRQKKWEAYWESKKLEEINYLRDLDILQVARDMGFTPIQKKNHWTLQEHDSVVFYDNNTFVRYSQETRNGKKVGGSPIDFYAHFNNLIVSEAIKQMKEHYIGDRELAGYQPREQPKREKEPVPFMLPQAEEGPWKRMFAYLTKTRGIDAEVVQYCIDKKLLYEEAGYHNTVFVGQDHTGKAVFASKRSSLPEGKFRMDVEGSNQANGWQVNHPGTQLLILTEAPIDAMSAMCIRKHLGRPIESANYLSTCGTGKAIAVLRNYMKKHKNITAVRIGMDNDEAGQKADRNIRIWLKDEYPHIKVGNFIPLQPGKDLNDAWRDMKARTETKQTQILRNGGLKKTQNDLEV